jgi:membrane peptidoglycan carboxypeptidase
VTPLQVVAGVSAIAAGGVYHSPRIVARVVQPDGTLEPTPGAASERRVMKPETARSMLQIMRGVTEQGGTAKQAAIEGYAVAGKTGTAQKAANGHYDPSKYVASFVGVVPADDPRLAIIVVLDEPQGAHLGGAVAAPIFKEIAEEALRYLQAPRPTAARDTDEVAANDGAATDLPPDDEALGDDPAMAGTWNEVAGVEGVGGDEAAESVVVPDFSGMSLGQAIHAARKSGVELAFDDPEGRATGVALGQRPAPGPAPRGVVCRVAFGRRP